MRAQEIGGVGVGLRRPYATELLERAENLAGRVDWIEVTPENWLRYGGARRRLFEQAIECFPGVPHSVSLSIGGTDDLDGTLIDAIGELCDRWGAPWWSDHLCYSSVAGAQLHELLPLPFNEEVIEHVARRAERVQAACGVPLVLENATYYAAMPGGTMDEASFLVGAVESADCGLLLDVNNVWVNSLNHGTDPEAFIDRMPMDRVLQIHVAGHTRFDHVVIDTHIGPVSEPVWRLYRRAIARAGRFVPTLIEWDQDIPPLDRVLEEVDRARIEAGRALGSEETP